MEMIMNEEQRKLVEDNINLARYMAHKWVKCGVQNFDHDDIFSMFSFALCKAARSFDPDNLAGAKFATYAARCMENEIKMAFRKKGNQLRNGPDLYLNGIMSEDSDGNTVELEEFISNNDHLQYDAILDLMCAKDAIKILKERELKIITMRYFHKESQKVIADKLKISQSYISRLEKRIIDKLAKFNRKSSEIEHVS